MRVRWCGIVLTLAGLSVWPPSGFGAPADRCVIEVTIEEGSGTPVFEADVTAIGPSVNQGRRAVTDGRGRASLLDLPAGVYRLEVSRAGYQWLEYEAVACDPGGTVRLSVTLEPCEGDEEVIMPAGPAVDAESTAVGTAPDRASLQALPRGSVLFADVRSGPPDQAIESVGSIRGGSDRGPGPVETLVLRRPVFEPSGSVGFAWTGGGSARTTGSRGAVSSVDDGPQVHAAAGWRAARVPLAGFVSVQGSRVGRRESVAFGAGPEADAIRRRNDSDRHQGDVFGALVWEPREGQRLEADLQAGRWSEDAEAITLHVAGDAPVPTGGETREWRRWRAAWHRLVDDRAAVWIEGRGGEEIQDWRPDSTGVLEQDATADGRWSGGLGNGIWLGSGNLAGFELRRQTNRIEVGGQWAGSGNHRLSFATFWERGDRRFRYSGTPGDLGFGMRRTDTAGGLRRWDGLAADAQVEGRETIAGVVLQDVWRLGSGLTAVVGIGWRDSSLVGAALAPRLRFGGDETLSPRVGLVWDFEGNGRSRVWLRWARFRLGAGEAVAWRLTGALDVASRFVDSGGGVEERPPGTMVVDGGIEPPVTDETVGGVEYELLSNLVVGAAGVLRRSDGGLAFLSQDGGRTLVLGSPSGPGWPEALEHRSEEAWLWIHKRLSNGWQAEVRAGWTRSRGTWEGLSTIDFTDVEREYLADVITPEALAGAWGSLEGDRRWRLDLSGSWRFRAGPSVGGRLITRSGAPVSRLGSLSDGFGLDRRFVEARGSAGRTPEVWRLDLVGSWPFDIGGVDAEVSLNIFNVFNAQPAVDSDQRWSVFDPAAAGELTVEEQRTSDAWGRPLSRQRPLEVRVGLTIRF